MDVNDLSYSFGFHLKELAEHEPERVSASSGISSARGALGERYPRLLSHRPAPVSSPADRLIAAARPCGPATSQSPVYPPARH